MNNYNMSYQGMDMFFTGLSSQEEDIFSMAVGNIFRVVNSVVLSSLISLFGIVSNAINMIVFFKQGFNTTTNISFFVMAISDMGCLITIQWFDICWNPYLINADINFIPEEIVYLSGGWFHICFGRVTSWITVFITAERFMGITFPLKVKQIITLRRTTIIMCFIFIINFAVVLPEYAVSYWDWKFVPSKNRTLYGLVYRSYKNQAFGLVLTITSVSGFVSFFLVLLLTLLLAAKLKRKSKWRKKVTGVSNKAKIGSAKNKKTVKMIILISIILIVCYTPSTLLSLVSAFVPEFMIGRAFMSSCYAFWSIGYLFSTVNSSVNVFLYYKMSTKYRNSFKELFALGVATSAQ